jgi:hypothetical protein
MSFSSLLHNIGGRASQLGMPSIKLIRRSVKDFPQSLAAEPIEELLIAFRDNK